MAEKKEKHFTTAEQKHKENIKLKCKVCGQKMVGKSTLSRHISHAHNEMDPADREKIVIDTYYGHDVVERTIRKFKNGEYKNKAVPIDIGKYLRLAEIKPEEEEEEEEDSSKDSNYEPHKQEYDSDRLLVKVKDLSDSNDEEKVKYLSDLLYNKDSNELMLTITEGETTAISYEKAIKFIEENKLNDSILFVSIDKKKFPVKSIEVKKDDEVAGSRVKCVVAYDSTKS